MFAAAAAAAASLQPHSVLGVYVHTKPVLGKDLHELEGDFLLDPVDLPAGGGGFESGGGGGGGGGGAVFYGDESGGSEVWVWVWVYVCAVYRVAVILFL